MIFHDFKHILFMLVFLMSWAVCLGFPSSMAISKDLNIGNTITIRWSTVHNVSGYKIKIFGPKKKLVVNEKVKENYYDWENIVPGDYTYQVASIDQFGRTGAFSPLGKLIIKKKEIKVRKPKITIGKENLNFVWTPNKYVKKYELFIKSTAEEPKTLFAKSTKNNEMLIPIQTFKDSIKLEWIARAYLQSNQAVLKKGFLNLPTKTSPIILIKPPNQKAFKGGQTKYLLAWKQEVKSKEYIINIWNKNVKNKFKLELKTKKQFIQITSKQLKNNIKIFWNVSANYKNKTITSPTRIFYIKNKKKKQKEQTLDLLSPIDNTSIKTPKNIYFSWSKIKNVKNYIFTLFSNTFGGKKLAQRNTEANGLTINLIRINHKSLSWNVIAKLKDKTINSKTRIIQIENPIKKKEKKKRPKKKKKKFKSTSFMSAFYTVSKGTFSESVDKISLQSNQDSPITLGAAYGYRFKKQSSISASFYLSKLDGSIYNNQQVSIPFEYGLNSYYNHSFNKFPVIPYIGIDHERFSTYNTDELATGVDLKTREHNITYLTLGLSKSLKLFNRSLLVKVSVSKSFHTMTSKESTLTHKKYSGMKYIFYLNMGISKKWMVHALYKGHYLDGPTKLSINRIGIGVGYRIF